MRDNTGDPPPLGVPVPNRRAMIDAPTRARLIGDRPSLRGASRAILDVASRGGALTENDRRAVRDAAALLQRDRDEQAAKQKRKTVRATKRANRRKNR